VFEAKSMRKSERGKLGQESLVEDELLPRQGLSCHGAKQARCVPAGAMLWVRDDARIDRTLAVPTELAESGDFCALKRAPD
jgi:hypothetical protein